MNTPAPAWDEEGQRTDRINDLIYELGLIDLGISEEDVVLGAMATNPVVRDMLAGIIRPEVFSDPDNRWIFIHLTGGDPGHVQMPMPQAAQLKLEYFELGAVQVGVMDAMRTGRELLAAHETERLNEFADAVDSSPAYRTPGIGAGPAPPGPLMAGGYGAAQVNPNDLDLIAPVRAGTGSVQPRW